MLDKTWRAVKTDLFFREKTLPFPTLQQCPTACYGVCPWCPQLSGLCWDQGRGPWGALTPSSKSKVGHMAGLQQIFTKEWSQLSHLEHVICRGPRLRATLLLCEQQGPRDSGVTAVQTMRHWAGQEGWFSTAAIASCPEFCGFKHLLPYSCLCQRSNSGLWG